MLYSKMPDSYKQRQMKYGVMLSSSTTSSVTAFFGRFSQATSLCKSLLYILYRSYLLYMMEVRRSLQW